MNLETAIFWGSFVFFIIIIILLAKDIWNEGIEQEKRSKGSIRLRKY